MNGLQSVLTLVAFFGTAASLVAQTPHLDALRYKNLGVAHLEQRQVDAAEESFRRVVELQPKEALGYVNLAMCSLRNGRLDDARSWVDQARQRAPSNPEILLRVGEVSLSAGEWSSAVQAFESVLEVEPQNLMAHYGIVVALGTPPNQSRTRERIARQVEKLYEIAPQNVSIALRYALEMLLAGNKDRAEQTLLGTRPLIHDLPSVPTVYRTALEAITHKSRAQAANELRRLINTLRPTSRYRQALAELQPPIMGIPVESFSERFYRAVKRERPRLGRIPFKPFQIRSWPQPVVEGGRINEASLDVADVDGDGREDLLLGYASVGGGGLLLWQTTTNRWQTVLGPADNTQFRAARFFDFDNDGRFEIVATGDTRTCLLEEEDGWKDVTEQAGLAGEPGLALELLDADNEGDLDLCLSTPSVFRMWQNRGDASFRTAEERSGLVLAGQGVHQIVALDYDDDLDADVCAVDAGQRLKMFTNLRHGRFQVVECGLDDAPVSEFVPADLDNDGLEDLLLVRSDGSVRWQSNDASRLLPAVPVGSVLHAQHVCAIDVNNDQWLDIVTSELGEAAPRLVVYLNRADGTWTRERTVPLESPAVLLSYADLNGDGTLDVITLDANGRFQVWQNDAASEGHWLKVQLRGLNQGGSKNNYFGIGCKVEIKSAANYQARFVRRPITHFGLGAKRQADLLRVIWSNGVPQNQFQPAANQTIREVQVLKGSCPYLYSWNGERFEFVTDLLAAAPLGLRPAEDQIAPDNPRELITVPRHQVADRDGQFVFQLTSELWETVYLDEVSLWVVDHPKDIDVLTDQRFRPPPYATPKTIFTGKRVFAQHATNTAGRDVTEQLRHFDYQYHDQLVPSPYQGIVRPHELVLDFGDIHEMEHPLLVLGCWIFWTDTSINVAVSQAKRPLAQSPILDVWEPTQRTWIPVDQSFWLPNGKNKWAVLDVSSVFPREQGRFRLRTSNQIYWDQAFLADARPEAPHRITRLAPMHSDLHFGGFHRLYRPTPDGPHLYDYSQTTSLPLWRTMTGLATRYGEVTELLTSSDDRMAIFTGGDELTIRFSTNALPALPPGWVRDFLFYSDGWEKDSDRNTLTGDTVAPLPFHAMSSYPYPADEFYPSDPLHDAYQKNYNTRPIGPEAFRRYVKEFQGSPIEQVPWANEPHVRGESTK